MRARGAWSRWWRPELALLAATVTLLQVAASSVTGALAEESESVVFKLLHVRVCVGVRVWVNGNVMLRLFGIKL